MRDRNTLTSKIRGSASEADLETCKLIDHWENIKPLHLYPASVPGVGQQIPGDFINVRDDSDMSSNETETDSGGDSEQYERLQLCPSTSQESPHASLPEDSGIGSSKENENRRENENLDDISMTSVIRPKRGRPPSKKKKKERTKPKRAYVRSGRYVIATNENSEIKLNLRPKS